MNSSTVKHMRPPQPAMTLILHNPIKASPDQSPRGTFRRQSHGTFPDHAWPGASTAVSLLFASLPVSCVTPDRMTFPDLACHSCICCCAALDLLWG